MPLYEFRCGECKTVNEYLVGFSDQHPTSCKSCGANSLQKIISKTSFILKGTGWYETDFKGSNGKRGEKADSSKSDASPEASKESPAGAADGEASSSPSPAASGTTSSKKAAASSSTTED